MELGPCASSSFEPCQTRKGAALRGNTTSAAGRLGSMAGSYFLQMALPTFHLNHQDSKRTKISRRFSSPFGITEVALHRLGSIYQTNRHFRKPNNHLVFLVPWW